jgi:hypothetical protein
MPQATAARKVVSFHQVRQAPNSAGDTTWAEIARHIANIDQVTLDLARRFPAGSPQAGACATLRKLAANMRRLQEAQRTGNYSAQADEGLGRIAGEFVPAVVQRVDWPRVPSAWLDSIRLSGAVIARLANQRRAFNQQE